MNQFILEHVETYISISDSSKVLMQDFHYDYIKNKYGDTAEMSLADTDSLMCKIETKNVYENFYKDEELFYFINYPKDSKCYNKANNLVTGKLKDETCSIPIKGFVRLKSKVYTFQTEGNHKSTKSKGINKIVVDDELKYEYFKNILFNRSYMRHKMNRIQSKYQNLK